MDTTKTETEAASPRRSALAQLFPEAYSHVESLPGPARAAGVAFVWASVAVTVAGLALLTAAILVLALPLVAIEFAANRLLWTLAVFMGGRDAWA